MQHNMEVILENCVEQLESTEEKPYVLPSWKVNEIILIAVRFLSEEGYYEDGFDYQKMIASKGILIKGFSAFKSENLLELQNVSLSLWNEGLCLVATDKETNNVCRMIAYNDSKSSTEIMQIIFHEYAHIKFGHTEQCQNGEAEAILFSAIATFLMIMEQQFHIGRLIVNNGGRERFFEGIKAGLMEKFSTKEVV